MGELMAVLVIPPTNEEPASRATTVRTHQARKYCSVSRNRGWRRPGNLRTDRSI